MSTTLRDEALSLLMAIALLLILFAE